MAYNFSKSDIPYETAYNAHRGTSFSPERRAKSEQQEYYQMLREAFDELYELAVKWDAVEKFEERFDYFADKFRDKFLAYLNSQNGLVSTMIAGPSNFPAARMNKKADQVHKKLNDLLSYYNLQKKKIKQYIKPAHLKPVKTGQSGAIDALQKKLDKRIAIQERMKAANKIVKSKKLSDQEKKGQLKKELNFSDGDIVEIMTPDYAGRIGFPGWALSNNNANIKRLKGRIATEKKLNLRREEGNKEHSFDGGKVIENYDLNRLQIKHDEKPPSEIIQKLKSRGFRWSPHYKAWQRNLNTTPMFYATDIVGEIKPVINLPDSKPEEEKIELSKAEQKAIEDQVKKKMEVEEEPQKPIKPKRNLADDAKIIRQFVKETWPRSYKNLRVRTISKGKFRSDHHILIESTKKNGNAPISQKIRSWFFNAFGRPNKHNNTVMSFGIIIYVGMVDKILKAIQEHQKKAEQPTPEPVPDADNQPTPWATGKFIEKAYLEGAEAAGKNEGKENPYPKDSNNWRSWNRGFNSINPKDVKKPEEEKDCPRNLHINKIHIDTARFQNREKLNQVVINEIAENFDANQFDPVVIWYDKKAEKWFLLAGHHRLKGAEKAGRKMVKTRCFEGTETEAIKYAKELSNANRTLETPMERAKIYRVQISKISKKELENKAKRLEGKNWNYILNLAFLKPTGKVFTALTALDRNSDKTTQQNLEKITDWTGEARRLFPQLTDAHEDEMYDFLLSNFARAKSISRKTDWITKINAVVHRLDFNPTQPLNLKRIAYKTQGESEYETQMFAIDERIKAFEKSKEGLKARFNDPKAQGYISPDDPEYETLQARADDQIKALDEKLKAVRKEKLDLMQKKGRMIKGGLDQGNLFAQATQKVDKAVKEIRKVQNKPESKNYKDLRAGIAALFRKKAMAKDDGIFLRENIKYIKEILTVAKKDKVNFSESDVIKLGIIIQPIIQRQHAIEYDNVVTNKRTLAPTFNNLLRWTGNPGRYDLIGVDSAKNDKPTILARKVKRARIFNLLGIR